MNFASIIEAIGVDLKLAIDDLVYHVKLLREDVEKLKQEKDARND